MKRAMALLIALLLVAGVAQAAEWKDGTGPSQPYPGVPETTLSEDMGYMMFFPSEKAGNGVKMTVESACQRLYIYLPREDVKLGEGTFYLCTEADGVIWSTEMDNTDAILQRPITEEELEGLMWGGGTCFEFLLPRTLELGKTYFVNMTRGCLITEDGVDSPEVGDTNVWTFTVEGDYGVSAMAYRRPLDDGEYEEDLLNPRGGDQIRFDLVLGGDAAMAAIYRFADESVEFEPTLYDTSCEVTGLVTKENPAWGVMFLNAQGEELSRVEFWQK